MIYNYTNKDYADKAIEANSKGQSLYVLVTPTDFEKDVLDFTTEIVKQPIYNENGEEIGTEDVELKVPVMVDKEIPIYDDEGCQTGTKIIKVQSSHKEKYTEDVASLIIAEANYYVCFENNYTYGEKNENYETEQAQRDAEYRIKEIKTALYELDLAAIRPLRAILAGTQTDEDLEKIKEIETKAKELRITISTLQ